MLSVNAFAEDCTPVLKPTKYQVQKGDHIAAILRTLKLEPVFGKNKSLEQLLKLNQVPNPNVINPNAELQIPFKCEEQVTGWQKIDRGSDRLLVREKTKFIRIDFSEPKPQPTNENEAALKPVEKIKSETVTETILNQNVPLKENSELDLATQADQPEISEALRYRMICEGEWTGSECISRYSTIFGTFGGWNNRYDGTDPSVITNNKGVLLSKLNPQVGIGWQNYWTGNFKTVLYAATQYSQLLPEGKEVPIDASKKWLGSFEAKARYEKGKWGVGLGMKYFDKLFYRFRFSGLIHPCLNFAGCGVFVHPATVLELSADLSYLVYQSGKFRYDVTGSYNYLGSASTSAFDVKPGYGFGVNFRVTHDRVKEYLFGEVAYSRSSQDTTIEKQTASELGFTFGYAWKLKDW